MTKKHLIILVLIASLSAFSLTSCVEDLDDVQRGPTLIEFSQLARTVNIGANVTGTVSDSVAVYLRGPNRPQLVGAYQLVADQTTATEGTHFTFAGTPGQVVFPAFSSVGFIKFVIDSDAIPGGESHVIAVRLGNNDTAEAKDDSVFRLTVNRN
jgi:hypothetical protein